MLRFTDDAIDHLIAVRRQKGHDAHALPRFVRRTERLALTFAEGPEPGDRMVGTPRVATLVADSATDLLDGATIDVEMERDRSVLVVRRGQRSMMAAPRR